MESINRTSEGLLEQQKEAPEKSKVLSGLAKKYRKGILMAASTLFSMMNDL